MSPSLWRGPRMAHWPGTASSEGCKAGRCRACWPCFDLVCRTGTSELTTEPAEYRSELWRALWMRQCTLAGPSGDVTTERSRRQQLSQHQPYLALPNQKVPTMELSSFGTGLTYCQPRTGQSEPPLFSYRHFRAHWTHAQRDLKCTRDAVVFHSAVARHHTDGNDFRKHLMLDSQLKDTDAPRVLSKTVTSSSNMPWTPRPQLQS
ncbi:hypothetical protein V8E55_010163 [Tylopilus felleus]